ncbi:MAG: tRNA (N(6)-L-threonylcarbamoyladenosine(37)-C(2))-methylthiotransferase [Desulfurococcales archaeon]|nr:tRNA (N(6)-L-threonylcarbamoyladenosine(37)-C(2))-methylthiotransferase [Desulfurococcales archaeon]
MGLKRYYMETYGCSLSEFDSLTMASILEARGYTRAETPEEADVVIVNTCAVRLDTEYRMVERITDLRGRARRLVVAGCLAKSRPGLVSRIAPEASLVSPQNASRIMEVVETGGRVVLLQGSRDTSWMPVPPLRDRVATVMIEEGCLNDCSFCISKHARRELKSYPPRLIVETVSRLVERGAREIRLTGLDTAAYGRDLPGKPTLADLVSMILDRVEGDYRIRVGMMTPELVLDILDDLLDVYRDERVFKFFHIPVQSGDDGVLKIMKRRYTVSEFKRLHARVKALFPDSMFATDIIVGHPGEGEEEFMATVRLVKELQFERVHLAQYSIRPHTRAAAMRQVPDPVKKERSRTLMRTIEEIGERIHRRYVGMKLKALVTERSFRSWSMTARLDNYFPVVLPLREELMGKWVDVVVKDASFFDLRGSVEGERVETVDIV